MPTRGLSIALIIVMLAGVAYGGYTIYEIAAAQIASSTPQSITLNGIVHLVLGFGSAIVCGFVLYERHGTNTTTPSHVAMRYSHVATIKTNMDSTPEGHARDGLSAAGRMACDEMRDVLFPPKA